MQHETLAVDLDREPFHAVMLHGLGHVDIDHVPVTRPVVVCFGEGIVVKVAGRAMWLALAGDKMMWGGGAKRRAHCVPRYAFISTRNRSTSCVEIRNARFRASSASVRRRAGVTSSSPSCEPSSGALAAAAAASRAASWSYPCQKVCSSYEKPAARALAVSCW